MDKVFSQNCTADNISKGFVAACQRLGIVDFSFHDLRHTAASWMRMSGPDIHTVATQLGHKDLRMAARYQHLSSDFMASAVGRLDAVFGHSSALESDGERASSFGSIVPTASPADENPRL